MPTVILLDVSLSMSRPVQMQDSTETHTRYTLAVSAINTFLDYLDVHSKLEYVALVAFSSLYEVVSPFTRDYDSTRNKLRLLEEFDRTSIDTAMHGVNHLVLNEWGHQTPIQIILDVTKHGAQHLIERCQGAYDSRMTRAARTITDGSTGLGAAGRARTLGALPLPPPYPARLHVLCVAPPNDTALPHSMPLYQKLVELASSTTTHTNSSMSRGSIYLPEQQLSVASITGATLRLCEANYSEFVCGLRCGQLEARVQLFPPPIGPDHEGARLQLAPVIDVCGFLHTADLGTPMVISKHLILPQAAGSTSHVMPKDSGTQKAFPKESASTESSGNEEDNADPSKVPNFCVLLHGALKVEGMSCIVQLADGWWGYVCAWTDAARARRSCLLLCAFAPGVHAVPWLGRLDRLGPAEEADEGDATAQFPVRPSERRSYAGGGAAAAWARPHALHSDVQKVLRHARKLPDKTQHFYKELNRIRRTAASLGFVELLGALATLLERECASLAPGTSPDCALQLTHAAMRLRAHDLKLPITPLATNFNIM